MENKNTLSVNKKDLEEVWANINWKKCQRHIDRLQKNIALAMKEKDERKIHRLQRILYKSRAWNLICIRKITQDNMGKKTAGVDKMKSLSPAQRMELSFEMNDKIERHWSPVRQVNILKKNGKTRTLGIPTIIDRIYQMKIKGIIEPCYEEIAEPNSYGFRPKRSTKDAIEQIFAAICLKDDAWILEGDLKGFFDNIKIEAITSSEIIKNDKELGNTIRNLVKSGAVTRKKELIMTEKGTPQGGVISPLLANIAFKGLETMIEKWAWDNRKRTGQKGKRDCVVKTIVYADDFVVIAKEKWIVEEIKTIVTEWCMNKMGVELSMEKTHITNIFDGFNFLGFNIRKYMINDTKSKTIIKPSKDSIKSVKLKIKEIINSSKGVTQEVLIGRLNPVIRGWAQYYKNVVSKEIFSSIDHYLFERLWAWANGKHNNKGKKWIKNKYWQTVGKRHWVFKTEEYTLYEMASTKITRHIKVQSDKHIYDGNDEYWMKRNLQNKDNDSLSKKDKCLKKQKFKCNICKSIFKEDSVIEVDHIIPRSKGGKDTMSNIQAVHRHCHHIKSKSDGSNNKKGK